MNNSGIIAELGRSYTDIELFYGVQPTHTMKDEKQTTVYPFFSHGFESQGFSMRHFHD